jgi:hypothetical protein
MLRFTCLFILVSLTAIAVSQTNIHFTNPAIYDVLKGNYDPADYAASIINDDPVAISQALLIDINPDSLKALLTAMQAFENRNTGSDTISETRGMGAARKWVLSKFDEYDARSENRLLTGFLQFDQDVCGMGRHKNIVAVLPGRNNTNPSSILIEAHLDSRCADNCDGDCLAQGMEDNGSGTALVMELARVMSKYTFDHTIIFMATTGEEQGLVGAEALAIYAEAEGIPIKAVLNNDIVGGVICGETSSPPSCPGLNHIDSTQVRLFSQGGFNSANKALSRYIKLQYAEMLKQHAAAPMAITIMSAEDRTGRGGDHIPFRERGFPAMRFTSANEHGNADVSSPDYHDRQHTTDDILGMDTNGDQELDSFFVNFNYLARNASINGNAAAMAALSPEKPEIETIYQNGDYLYVKINDPHDYLHYVIGLRIFTNDFDTLYYISGEKEGVFELPSRQPNIFVSAASIDDTGVESLFSTEKLVALTGTEEVQPGKNVQLFQNRPNPFDESTIISFWVENPASVHTAKLTVTDMQGRLIKEFPVTVQEGMNEVLFEHGYNMTGTFFYTLFVNDQRIETKKMVFAN